MSADTSPTPNPLDDELLSALLDGELSNEDRARVEAQLANNSDARQLFNELRNVSDAVRTLPPHSVDAGFQESVMASIRRAEEGGTETGAPVSAWLRGRARGLAWSALAIAAALFVMFVSGEWPAEDREVARRAEPSDGDNIGFDRVEDIAAPKNELPIAGAKDDGTILSPASRAKTAVPTDGEGEKLNEAESAPVERWSAMPGEDRSRGQPDGEAEPSSETKLARGVGGRGGAAVHGEMRGAGRGGHGSGLGGAGHGGYGDELGDAGRGGYGGGLEGAGRGGGMMGSRDRVEYRNGRGRRTVTSKDTEVENFRFESQAVETIQRFVDQGVGPTDTLQLVRDLEKIAPAGEPLLVVQVDLSPSAVRTQAFDKTLVRNTIRPEEPRIDRDSGSGRGGPESVALLYDLASKPSEEVVAVLVDATSDQLHATLNDLRADVSNCVNLKVESNDLSLAAQRQWEQYDRGQVQFFAGTNKDVQGLAARKIESARRMKESTPSRPLPPDAAGQPFPSDSPNRPAPTEAPGEPLVAEDLNRVPGTSDEFNAKTRGSEREDDEVAIRSLDRDDDTTPAKGDSSDDVPKSSSENQKARARKPSVEDVRGGSGASPRFGRAQRVQLARPNQDREHSFGVVADREATAVDEATQEDGGDRETSGLAASNDRLNSKTADGSERQLPKQKHAATNRDRQARLLTSNRARAIFLLRIVSPDTASATPPATSSPAKP